MKQIRSYIPNTITLLNLLCGCIAVTLSFHSDTVFDTLTGQQWACIFIATAAVFDFCDGASARLLGAYSDIGKELDSLSDLVSFGVAPAMLLLNSLLLTFPASLLPLHRLPSVHHSFVCFSQYPV